MQVEANWGVEVLASPTVAAVAVEVWVAVAAASAPEHQKEMWVASCVARQQGGQVEALRAVVGEAGQASVVVA